MSVNGFDDSKNRKEVYTKEEVDVKYKTRGDFAVIYGRVLLEANSNLDENVAKQTVWNISYPSGFTKDNCVCIAFGGNRSSNMGYGYGYLIQSDLALAVAAGVLPRVATLNNNSISCMALNPSSNEVNLNYKIVLMKHEVLDSEYTLGDVNQDGQVTQEDKDILDEYVLNGTALTEQQLKAADVNKDGYVDTGDTYKLQQYLANGTPLE